MLYKLLLGALGTMEDLLAKWHVFHWVHTKSQLPHRKGWKWGREMRLTTLCGKACLYRSRSGSQIQHSHPLSILRDEGRKNISLPGWCKPDTGLALAWEALSILRFQRVTHAQGCLFRSEVAETSGVPFFCVGLHKFLFHLYDGKCGRYYDLNPLNIRSMDSPH